MAAFLALVSFAHAQPAPKLGAVFPIGGQQGSAPEISFYGQNLSNATGLIFSGEPGLSATILPKPEPTLAVALAGVIAPLASNPDEPLRAKIEIVPGAPLGRREVRVVTPGGISAPLSFYVGAWPEAAEAGGNNTSETAQKVEFPVTIDGAVRAKAEVDCYRFSAKAGQRLIFDAASQRLGFPLDGVLELYDLSGKKLLEDQDTNGTDPLLDFTAPADGDYIVKLRDVRYDGSGNHIYRLTMGEVPYLDALYPLGAARGSTVDLALRGRNLAGAMTQKISIAPDAPLGIQEMRAMTPKGPSNPRSFFVGAGAEIAEAEPNPARENATAAAVPSAVSGRLGEAGDVDTFKVTLEKDVVLIAEVFGRRLGSPIDALLTVEKADGTVLARDDDSAGADARLEFGAPEAGDYFISVRDLLERGGEDFAYRLSLARREPDFSLRFSPDAIRIRRGAKTSVKVDVTRGPGFGGEVLVSAPNLPPGLSAEPTLIPRGSGSGLLMIAAAMDAELGVKPLAISGEGVIGGRRAARGAAPVSEDRPVMAGYALVAEAAPFEIELLTLAGSVEQNSGIPFEIAVRRREGFAGDIALSAGGMPRGMSFGGGPAKAGADLVRATLNANIETDPGRYPIHVIGEASDGGASFTQMTTPIDVDVREFPFMLTRQQTRLSLTGAPEGVESEAAQAAIAVRLIRRGWFSEGVTLTLEGLPAEGFKAEIPNIAREQVEATITLRANEKAPADKPFEVRVVGQWAVPGRTYIYRADPITITVSAPAAAAGN